MNEEKDSDNELIESIFKKKYNLSKSLIKNGFDINMQDNEGYTPLMTSLCNSKYKINDENDNKYTEANFERDYDMIKLLLKHGANPNLKNSDGCTIFDFLMINKIYKSIHIIKIIKLLLENNINIDTYHIHGYTLLHHYICEKKYDIVKFLIENDAKVNLQGGDGESALELCIEEGNLEIIELLLKHSANPNLKNNNGEIPIQFIPHNKYNYKSIINLLMKYGTNINSQDNTGRTVLMDSVKHLEKDFNIINILIEYGADINIQDNEGLTALIIASEQINLDIIKILLKYKYIDINLQDNEGSSVLMWASTRNLKVLDLLLNEKKIDINLQGGEFGGTALLFASCEGKLKMVNRLLECTKQNGYSNSININLPFYDGNTALIIASKWGHLNVVNSLLNCEEIDVNLRNKNKWTAIHCASLNGHLDIINQLLNCKEFKVNFNDISLAINLAARNKHYNIVKFLLSK